MGKIKRILSAVLAVGMLTFATPMGVFAVDDVVPTTPTETPDVASGNAYSINMLAETVYEHNISDGSIVITSTGYSVGDGAEIPYTGDYLIYSDDKDTSVGNTITVKNGTHNITITDVNIGSSNIPFDIQAGAEVNLTLNGTNTLTAINSDNAALHVPDSAKLTITEESEGKLTAHGGIYGAGIGSNSGACGTITINGGTVKATSNSDNAGRGGAGIGGGIGGAGGTITISGSAHVAAASNGNGAGIGGGGASISGKGGAGGTITIDGGIVAATSDWGAGIGGGESGDGGKITIDGGIVTATSNLGAGIGGGCFSNGGEITISGGTVTATSDSGAGIGVVGADGKITISGGTVEAISKGYGAGIGGGNGSDGGNITISDNADVTATANEYGAGIGGGKNGAGGTITISGGTVEAISKGYGAGIGGGERGDGGNITISGGNIEAHGSSGAGIGGGRFGAGETITITGGTVSAFGVISAGIGGGNAGTGGNITISGGTVSATGGEWKTAGQGIGNGANCEIMAGNTFIADGNAVVFASNNYSDGITITDMSGKQNGEWNGIIFEFTQGKVYGNVTLGDDLTIPENYTLEIAKGTILDLNDFEITNNGTIETHCTDKNIYDGTVNRAHGTLTHNNAIAPTCTTDGNSEYWACEDCKAKFADENGATPFVGETVISKLGHDHSVLQNDDTDHWYKCSRCDDTTEKETHSFGEWIIDRDSTETATGAKHRICDFCKYVDNAVIPEKDHECVFGAEWTSDETNHWHECACGKKSDIAPHTEDGGTIAKEPTTDSKGEKLFKCTVCGRVLRTEVIDKLPEETEAPTTTPSGVVVTYIITENVTLGAGVEEEASRSSGIIPIAVIAVICVGAAFVSKKKKEE